MDQGKEDISFTEQDIYSGWEKLGYFASNPASSSNSYTIMIPPPNVTGNLHVGHALTMTLQDILIRFKRMNNFDVLWQPGTDHAGIATQMMVERKLHSQGLDRKTLGRENFIKEAWQWKNESGNTITSQLRRLGASLDWEKERFTLDESFSDSVRTAFVTLYNDGLIYRAKRLVNWDPKLQSALSDLEVKNKEMKSSLWYINYPIEGTSPQTFITVATTRPETLLGDTAIAVHPTDKRYSNLIGKFAIVPLVGRSIPIISDEYSDKDKGSGAVKITPAHDFNDFQVGERHNLPMPNILNVNGCISLKEIQDDLKSIKHISNKEFILQLEGMQSLAARNIILEELDKLKLLAKIEPHISQVPYAERGGAIVEPFLTTQWFCNAGELAKKAIQVVEDGEVKFVPQNWEKTFFIWMNNIQPWCISRQLWWGHRIPAWYGPDSKIFVYHTKEEALIAARKLYQDENIDLTQDDDVLDTWFSSALWPFATLGWPNQTPELDKYYSTDVLVTGFDIIFYWVARMMMMGLYFMKKVPFHTVFIHGLILDEHGQKMSKTKGNVIDPLEIMEKYGADTLRWSVCSLAGPGRDLKLSNSQILTSRSFVTKINNAIKFWQSQNLIVDSEFVPSKVDNELCVWLLKKLDTAIIESTNALESYRFDYYTETLYNFVWHIFCDWFIELAKPILLNGPDKQILSTASFVIDNILRLLHPSIPFITEEIWDNLGYGPKYNLIKANWPQSFAVTKGDEAVDNMILIIKIINAIRSLRVEKKIPPQTKIPILFKTANLTERNSITNWQTSIIKLTRAENIAEVTSVKPKSSIQTIVENTTIIIPLETVINPDEERNRLQQEILKAEEQVSKHKLLFSNKDFINKASINVIAGKKEQIKLLNAQIIKLNEALKLIDN